MQAWQQLALLEWRRSTFQGKQNLDFFWLTILLTLTLLLTLLLWGGREGLLNKFVDVSIGYVEDAGIPIWLATNRIEGIDRPLLQQLATQPITIYPYREVEWHQISFPQQDENIWQDKAVPFMGWAVSSTDPLWKETHAPENTIPLAIILNRRLFTQHFNCEAYIAALQKPLALLNIDDPKTCLANNTLWLEVKTGHTRTLLPFRIHWQPHLPTVQPLAFLLPLSTLNTLLLVNSTESLSYYPDLDGDRWVKQLLLRTDTETVDAVMTNLSLCLPSATIRHRRVTLATPLPETWLKRCFAEYGVIPLKTDKQMTPYFKITEFLTIPYTLTYDNQQNQLTITCRQNANCQPCTAIPSLQGKTQQCEAQRAVVDLFKAIGGYQRAFVYVEDRAILSTHLEKIKNFPPDQEAKAFYFHHTYDDALVRFKFIDKIMQLLELCFSPFFILFIGVLLVVQIGMVITHRKHNYGILLAKGVAWRQIQWIIFLQLTMSFGVAISMTILMGEGMQTLLAAQLAQITTMPPYIDHIVTSGLDLLPLTVVNYLQVGGVILFVLHITGFLLLKILIAKHYQEPAYLFLAS